MKTVPAKKKKPAAASKPVKKKKAEEDTVAIYISDESYAQLEKMAKAAKMGVDEYFEKVLAK